MKDDEDDDQEERMAGGGAQLEWYNEEMPDGTKRFTYRWRNEEYWE